MKLHTFLTAMGISLFSFSMHEVDAQPSEETLTSPEVSESYQSFIDLTHEEEEMAAYEEKVTKLIELTKELHAGKDDVRPISDYLEPTKRELRTIDDWFAEKVRNSPGQIQQLLKERDSRINEVWKAFRRNRSAEYRSIRITKSDFQHASRGPVTWPGGPRGRTERTCKVEAPSEEYILESARMSINSRMGDTHVGEIDYLSDQRGCTLYIYARARSFGNTERSRIGVTLYGTFKLADPYVTNWTTNDEQWLKAHI